MSVSVEAGTQYCKSVVDGIMTTNHAEYFRTLAAQITPVDLSACCHDCYIARRRDCGSGDET